MKNFTIDYPLAKELLKKEVLSSKDELQIKHILIEMDIAVNGYVELSQLHYNQKKRWDSLAEVICIFRDEIKEKLGEKNVSTSTE